MTWRSPGRLRWAGQWERQPQGSEAADHLSGPRRVALGDSSRETLAKPVNNRPFTLLLGSTSCGNRPVRRATPIKPTESATSKDRSSLEGLTVCASIACGRRGPRWTISATGKANCCVAEPFDGVLLQRGRQTPPALFDHALLLRAELLDTVRGRISEISPAPMGSSSAASSGAAHDLS